MFRRVRIKFMIISMTAMVLMTALLIGSVNLTNLLLTNHSLDVTLEELIAAFRWDDLSEAHSPAPAPPHGMGADIPQRHSAAAQYAARFFVVSVSPEGESLLLQNDGFILSEEASALAEEVLAGTSSGFFRDYKYRVIQGQEQTLICFLDCSTEIASLHTLLYISLVVGGLGLVVAFPLIFLLSGRAIRPLRESMEKQKRFITDAGHELKSPLSVILANMDILEMDIGENEWVEGTRRQAGRLSRLVADLIVLSRMEEDRAGLNLQKLSLTESAAETVAALEPLAAAQGKKIELHIEKELSILGDEAAIRQLLTILCDNSIQYTPAGKLISFRLYRDGGRIVFETANPWDRSLDKDQLDRLFDRFYRADSSRDRSRGTQGYGLGLSIARAIAIKHLARLSVSEDDAHRLVFQASFPPAI